MSISILSVVRIRIDVVNTDRPILLIKRCENYFSVLMEILKPKAHKPLPFRPFRITGAGNGEYEGALSIPRKLIRNSVALLGGNVVGQIFNLFALLLLARVLTLSTFRVWNFAGAWVLYLSKSGEFGLEIVGLLTLSVGVGPVTSSAKALRAN